jgi:hypothetical protein
MTPELPTKVIKKRAPRKPKAETPTPPTQEVIVVAAKVLGTAERLLCVQTEAKTVLKSGHNKFSHYQYATEGDYQNELKPLLKKHGLVLIPKGVMNLDVKGSTVFITMKWLLGNVDNHRDTHTFTFVGAGRDTEAKSADVGDKAVAKAMTMANKYMLAKLFQLESEDDADKGDSKGEDKKDGKKPAAGAKTGDTQAPVGGEFAKALNMIKTSNNVDGLINWAEKIKDSKLYTQEQKLELQKAINSRVDQLSQG